MGDEGKLAPAYELSEIVSKVRARTPARLLAGRTGAAYRTNTQLELREAHAAARDAVRAELNLSTDLVSKWARRWTPRKVCSKAATKDEFLLHPDLGRQLSVEPRARVSQDCPWGVALQVVIGDGLSVTAVATQVPRLL